MKESGQVRKIKVFDCEQALLVILVISCNVGLKDSRGTIQLFLLISCATT